MGTGHYPRNAEVDGNMSGLESLGDRDFRSVYPKDTLPQALEWFELLCVVLSDIGKRVCYSASSGLKQTFGLSPNRTLGSHSSLTKQHVVS